MEDNDTQLPLKKRARRRLVGAIFFVSVVAVVLPMVMDHEPRQTVQDVEIRIPGQDEKPFAPKFAVAPVEKAAPKVVEAPAPVAVAPEARVVEPAKAVGTTVAKPEKAAVKAPEKPAEKPAEKPRADDAKRAAAILGGQAAEAKPAPKNGEYLVLIGAFSNEANVRNLKAKLAEEGIKTFSEPLDTPQGKKTRVRAGPFATREAADKALEKMKRIGVSGVVAAKP
jgi:DedD protein